MRLVIFLISLLFISYMSSYAGKMYKWVDDEGSLHVTDNPTSIPAKYRDQVKSKDVKSHEPGAKNGETGGKFVYMCVYEIKGGGDKGEDYLTNILFYSENGIVTKWSVRERIPDKMSYLRNTFDEMLNKKVSELPKGCVREAQ